MRGRQGSSSEIRRVKIRYDIGSSEAAAISNGKLVQGFCRVVVGSSPIGSLFLMAASGLALLVSKTSEKPLTRCVSFAHCSHLGNARVCWCGVRSSGGRLVMIRLPRKRGPVFSAVLKTLIQDTGPHRLPLADESRPQALTPYQNHHQSVFINLWPMNFVSSAIFLANEHPIATAANRLHSCEPIRMV